MKNKKHYLTFSSIDKIEITLKGLAFGFPYCDCEYCLNSSNCYGRITLRLNDIDYEACLRIIL